MDAEKDKLLFRKAGDFLARRAHSRGELKRKLARTADGYPLDSILDRLEQLKLLNDADFAYNFALCSIRQKAWGPARIKTALLRKHVAAAVAEAALQRVHDELGDESDPLVCIQRYCKKKGLPADAKEARRLVGYLRRQGYRYDTIFERLRQFIPQDIWQRFETGD